MLTFINHISHVGADSAIIFKCPGKKCYKVQGPVRKRLPPLGTGRSLDTSTHNQILNTIDFIKNFFSHKMSGTLISSSMEDGMDVNLDDDAASTRSDAIAIADLGDKVNNFLYFKQDAC